MFFSILTPSYFFFFIYLFVVIKPENPYLASRSGLGVNSLGVYPLGPRTSSCGLGAWFRTTAKHSPREREKFIIRQPPIGGKDDYDSENSWISDGLPSSSRRRRRDDGRGVSGERSEVQARSSLTSTAPTARSRSREVATRDETPRISLRVSSKLLTSASSLLS